MEELILSKWDEILSLLETEHGLSPIVVKTWIKPLKLYSVEGKNCILQLMIVWVQEPSILLIKNVRYVPGYFYKRSAG